MLLRTAEGKKQEVTGHNVMRRIFHTMKASSDNCDSNTKCLRFFSSHVYYTVVSEHIQTPPVTCCALYPVIDLISNGLTLLFWPRSVTQKVKKVFTSMASLNSSSGSASSASSTLPGDRSCHQTHTHTKDDQLIFLILMTMIMFLFCSSLLLCCETERE